MKLISLAKITSMNLTVVICWALFLYGCVVGSKNTMTVHHLSVPHEQEVLVNLQLASRWKVKPDMPKDVLTLYTRDSKAQATIVAKKMETEEVTLKLLKTFGRIDIKDMASNGWVEERFSDDVQFDGKKAVRYYLRKEAEAANVYFVANGQHGYIITITAPLADIELATDEIGKSVFIGKKSDEKLSPQKVTQQQTNPYSPPFSILDLAINDFDQAEKTCLKESFKELPVNDQVLLIEQVCVKYALYKSEALYFVTDKDIIGIFNEVDILTKKYPSHLGLARCMALIAFMKNMPAQAVAQLETLLRKNPEDIYAKLYLVMIRPYDTVFIEKTINESSKLKPGNKLTVYMHSKRLLAEGKQREGFDLLRDNLLKDQKNKWIKYAVARNEQNEGHLSEAKISYTDLLQSYSTFTPARYSLAFLEYKEKNFEAAEDHLKMILSVHPEDPGAILLQGLLLKNKKKFSEAKAAFADVLAIEPDNYRALYNIGALCATELKDPICARQAFSRYVSVAPEDNRHDSIVSWLNKH